MVGPFTDLKMAGGEISLSNTISNILLDMTEISKTTYPQERWLYEIEAQRTGLDKDEFSRTYRF